MFLGVDIWLCLWWVGVPFLVRCCPLWVLGVSGRECFYRLRVTQMNEGGLRIAEKDSMKELGGLGSTPKGRVPKT